VYQIISESTDLAVRTAVNDVSHSGDSGREYESKAENNLVYAAGLALFSMLRGSDPD